MNNIIDDKLMNKIVILFIINKLFINNKIKLVNNFIEHEFVIEH